MHPIPVIYGTIFYLMYYLFFRSCIYDSETKEQLTNKYEKIIFVMIFIPILGDIIMFILVTSFILNYMLESCYKIIAWIKE